MSTPDLPLAGPGAPAPTPRRGAVDRARARRRRLGSWLTLATAIGWVALWCCAAWAGWQNAVSDRDLARHGERLAGTVAAAAPGVPVKLLYCRQPLQVAAPGHDPVTADAVRWCTRPWRAGERIDVVTDPASPGRAVPVEEVRTEVETHVLPLLVAAMSAVAAGFPLGRLWAARLQRREDAWLERLGRPD